jgi:type III pantothenate kinase
MLLAVEVGNTNAIFGLFADNADLVASYRLSTERERMPDEWFTLLSTLMASDRHDTGDIDGVIISSVVPSVTTWLVAMARDRFRLDPVVVRGDLDIGLKLDVEEPKQLGADRIADCVAAIATYGSPVIVVDLGTATTFDVVGRDGAYKGGAIAAGVATTLKALAGNAAQLFNVELGMPANVIGRYTADQLRSGLVAGHLAMLEGMIARTQAELGEDAPVIVTGGLAPLFVGASSLFDHYDPDLTLRGLRLIYDRVRHGAPAEIGMSPSVSGANG